MSKPVPLAATERDLSRVVNQLVTYWNQGIDANVLRDQSVKASKLSFPLLLPDGKVGAPSLAFAATGDQDSGLYRIGTNIVGIALNGVEQLRFATTEVVFNEGSGDIDFRVETNASTHGLFVDAGTSRVGINKSAPADTLEVHALTGQAGFMLVSDQAGQNPYIALQSYSNQIYVDRSTGSTILTAGTGQITLTSAGRVGFGSAAAAFVLHVRSTTLQTGIGIEDNTGQNPYLVFQTTATQIYLDRSNNDLIFNRGSTERFRLTSTGAKVTGTLNVTGAVTLDGAVTLGTDSADSIQVKGILQSSLLFTEAGNYDIGASGATRPRHLYLAGLANIAGSLDVAGITTLAAGTAAAPALVLPADPDTGLYQVAANCLGLAATGVPGCRVLTTPSWAADGAEHDLTGGSGVGMGASGMYIITLNVRGYSAMFMVRAWSDNIEISDPGGYFTAAYSAADNNATNLYIAASTLRLQNWDLASTYTIFYVGP